MPKNPQPIPEDVQPWFDPDDLVSAADIAAAVGVDRSTPRIWWHRTRHGKLNPPMPEPVSYIGRYRSPVWYWSDIQRWYSEYKNKGGRW